MVDANLPKISPVGPSNIPKRRRIDPGVTECGRRCLAASCSAVALQIARKPLGTPPTSRRVRVTGFAKMFASRKMRMVLPCVSEEVYRNVVAPLFHDVAHRLAPKPIKFLKGDAVPVAYFDGT